MSERATVVPPQLVAILDQAPLCVGEDRALYDQLRDMLMDEIKPTTVTEYLLAYDIAKAEWELLRLYGFKAGMINLHMLPNAFNRIVGISAEYNDILRELLRSAFEGNSEACDKLQNSLRQIGVPISVIAAKAFENNIKEQMQTDHLVNAALQRREAAYDELERRRRNRITDTSKRIVAPVIDGELSPTPESDPALDIITPSEATSVSPTSDSNSHV